MPWPPNADERSGERDIYLGGLPTIIVFDSEYRQSYRKLAGILGRLVITPVFRNASTIPSNGGCEESGRETPSLGDEAPAGGPSKEQISEPFGCKPTPRRARHRFVAGFKFLSFPISR